MDEIQRWLPTILAAVAAVVFVVRSEQSGRVLKDQMSKLEKFREDHTAAHTSIGETLVVHREKIATLERETGKDHERIRVLQINTGAARDPTGGE